MGTDGKQPISIVNIISDFLLKVKASCNQEIVDLLNDTYRFLFSHNQTISESAMHTYYSALPFTPHDTRLYCLYEQETSHSINVLQGLNPTWTSCLSCLSLDGCIQSVSPDGTRIAVTRFNEIWILDARTTASQCDIYFTDNPDCLAFSPTESTLAAVSSNRLELCNTMTGIKRESQKLSGEDFYTVAFSSRGQCLLLSIDQSLHLHDGMNASELSVLSTDWCHTSIVFTSDDMQVITGSEEGHIHFFTLSSNRLSEIRERRISNETGVLGLALRHDGKMLASSGEDGAIRIYDLPSPSPIATLLRPENKFYIRSIAYHPTEQELAVAQGRCVVLWRQQETPSGWVASTHGYHDSRITGIAYCENGTRMYTSAERGDIKLWANTTTHIQELHKHAEKVTSYAVNRSALLLATGSRDMSIILWKFTTGDHLRTLLGHTRRIDSLVFSDDGVLLASGSRDRTTMVWDVKTGSLLHKLGPHDSCKNVSTFSEDNAHLTTKTYGATFVWELKSGELLEEGQSGELLMQRKRSTGVNKQTRFYYLEDLKEWHGVMEHSKETKQCKIVFRPPTEYGTFQFQHREDGTPIVGDRAVLLCDDGRVLILDISRVMHVIMDPARQISDWWWPFEWRSDDGHDDWWYNDDCSGDDDGDD